MTTKFAGYWGGQYFCGFQRVNGFFRKSRVGVHVFGVNSGHGRGNLADGRKQRFKISVFGHRQCAFHEDGILIVHLENGCPRPGWFVVMKPV
ncbi:hypothetical protein [Aquabacterium sp.]|uniref:hypothetical protein n=1 Tax=Aquabacterium sp. TaxID=1872578 RepID=UPI0025C2757A|nr:hypothetical protein [Aquabacterium sp.]